MTQKMLDPKNTTVSFQGQEISGFDEPAHEFDGPKKICTQCGSDIWKMSKTLHLIECAKCGGDKHGFLASPHNEFDAANLREQAQK